MKLLLKKLFKTKLYTRFFGYFLLLAIIPSIIVSIAVFYFSEESVRNDLSNLVQSTLDEKVSNLNCNLSNIEDLVTEFSNSQEVKSLLLEIDKPSNNYNTMLHRSEISTKLSSIYNLPNLMSISIVSLNGNSYYFNPRSSVRDIEIPEEHLKFYNTKGINQKIWIGKNRSIEDSKTDCLSIISNVYNFDKNEKDYYLMGKIIIQLSLDRYNNIFSNGYISKYRTLVLDKYDNIIYKNYSDLDPKSKDENRQVNIYNINKYINSNDFDGLAIESNIRSDYFKVLVIVDEKYIRENHFDMLLLTLGYVLILILTSFGMFSLFSKRLLKPISLIKDKYKNFIDNDDKEPEPFKVVSDDEIGDLQKWFNEFLATQSQRRDYTKEIVIERDKSERANKAKDIFIANVSHDFRTPLNGILSISEMLNETNLTPLQQEYTETISSSANLLYQLINELLDFSKLYNDSVKLHETEFNLYDFCSKISKLFRFKAQHKKLKFTTDFKLDKNIYITADEGALQKITYNILGNSIKYTREGKVEFIVKTRKIEKKSIAVRFSFIDTGIGVPEKKLASIFNAFEQVDDSLTKKIEGTGLGLSISQKLVHLMGSEIIVQSPYPKNNNSGSHFYFDVRFKLSKHKKLSNKVNNEESSSDIQDLFVKLNSKILIVEDNKINQKVLCRILERFELRADIASHWRECLKLLDKRDYDLIFMDIQMPEMSGFELTKVIRNRGIKSTIIAVTGNVLDEFKEKATICGMNGFLTKPVRVSDIEQIIHKHLT